MTQKLRHPRAWSRLFTSAVALVWALPGCSTDSTPKDPGPPTPSPGDFVSAVPGGQNSRGGLESGDGAGSPTAGPSPQTPDAGEDGDPQRAIEEADVIKIDGDRLYALSQYGGLSVIDISQRDQLKMLGRHKVAASPFEMYVRDGMVFALYNGYGNYEFDAAKETWQWYQTSSLVALDARDPAAIEAVSTFEIPGNISDSRIVGDVLYVAAYENGSCWGCDTAPRTNVMSLSVKNPRQPTKIDQLSFAESTDTYSWKRSLTVTEQRMYVAGPRYGNEGPVGSSIQVIDISNPSGDMQEGASVDVVGQIDSRWQMDEHDGVLRVISQPMTSWRNGEPPQVQTFSVQSSDVITPLGSLELVLPRAESLQSVRFDGERAYAITFERTDPLFTIDLRDPMAPVQKGELEMPGFLYHMEPRGNRLIGLGYDQGNAAGALTVSIFDVEDLSKPSMLSRVNFGGNWAWLGEDQDRIHKAFNVLDSAGLILVPFSGSYYENQNDQCSYRYQSGIQLVDWEGDALRLRGVAPAVGQARRGIVHDGRLLAMSDERVESFDINNRDKPANTATLRLAQNVQRSVPVGDHVVRIAQNWWTSTTELDVVPLSEADRPSPAPAFEVPELGKGNGCYSSSWLGSASAAGSDVYLAYEGYDYSPDSGKSTRSLKVVTVNASDPSKPEIAGRATLAEDLGYYYAGYGVVDSGLPFVNIGSTLAVADRNLKYDEVRADGSYAPPRLDRSSLVLADMRDPNQPVATRVDLPLGYGATGLIASGNVVATSHFELSNEVARFYLDRVGVGAEGVTLLPKVNIPGSLLAYEAATQRAFTVDYSEQVVENLTWQQCYERYPAASFETGQRVGTEPVGRCRNVRQTLKLVEIVNDQARVLGSLELGESERVSTVAVGDDRLFISLANGYGYYGVGIGPDCIDCGTSTSSEQRKSDLLVLSGLGSGQFSTGRIALAQGAYYGGHLRASGRRAILASGYRGMLSVVSAENAAAPALVREVELPGYVYDLTVASGVAIASLGQDGVQTIPLAD